MSNSNIIVAILEFSIANRTLKIIQKIRSRSVSPVASAMANGTTRP